MNKLINLTNYFPTYCTKVQSTDNLLGADNDQEVLALFLKKAGARSKETYRRYERELIRFTFFLYHELKIDYQLIRLKHLHAYFYFLKDLPEKWLKPGLLFTQPKKIFFKRSIPEGKSCDQIIAVLSSFFTFLHQNNYIKGNPASALVRTSEKHAKGYHHIRFFYKNEWLLLNDCIKNLPEKNLKEKISAVRTRLMIHLAYGLALRESELTSHSCKDIHIDYEGNYILDVLGKGKKRRQLPLNDHLLKVIKKYKEFYQFHLVVDVDDLPLAPRLKKNKGEIKTLTSRGFRYWWKQLMIYCSYHANSIEQQNRFLMMPFHSIRHTALTHLAEKMSLENLAIFAGHESIQTTSQYYHVETKRLRELTEEHSF